MKLSVVIITKDEEDSLPRCLESLYFEPIFDDWGCGRRPLWDELVVVDTGSTDQTVEIAKKHGARVEHFDWVNDFSAARNYAESLCMGDYVYVQDADEVMASGHELVRAIVDKGEEIAVRPIMVFSRDEFGNPVQTYARQDLLHRKGSHVWKDAIHEWTEGTPGRIEKGIVIEQIPRPGGDRSHGNMFQMLRTNLLQNPSERHLFYLTREYFYAGNYYEVIGLVDQLLERTPEWCLQRSHAAILKGDALKHLNRVPEARVAYLRAVQEWGAWAEPYYSLGVLHYEAQQWSEGASWFSASLLFEPPDEYFSDQSIYSWRRYDLLAVCLSKIGRLAEAYVYGSKALSVRPEDQRLKDNMKWYQEAQ